MPFERETPNPFGCDVLLICCDFLNFTVDFYVILRKSVLGFFILNNQPISRVMVIEALHEQFLGKYSSRYSQKLGAY